MKNFNPKNASPTRRVLCIVCAQKAEMKLSIKLQPYVFCPHCRTRIFLYGERGEAGYFLTQDLLLPVAPQHQRILETRIDDLIEIKKAKK